MDFQMEHWNKIRIPTPPNLTLIYSSEEHDDNINKCVASLNKRLLCLKLYLNQDVIHQLLRTETSILRDLLTCNEKFRTEKFFGLLKKVLKCVEHLKQQHLPIYVIKLQEMMPVVSVSFRSVRLPTRDMFECLLTKIYGAFKLLLTLVDNCKEAARYVIAKINVGHMYMKAVAFLAVAARIRALSLDFADHLASAYDDILPQLADLKGMTKSSLVGGSACLMDELTKHSKVGKTAINSKLLRSIPSSDVELNVLDIFNTFDEDGLEAMDDDNEEIASAGGVTFRPEITVLSERKIAADPKIVNQSKNSKAKEQLLSLLDIFDDEKDKNSSRQFDVRNENEVSNRLPSNAEISASLVLDEDLGETVESGRRELINQRINRKGKHKNFKAKKSKVSVREKYRFFNLVEDNYVESVSDTKAKLDMINTKSKKNNKSKKVKQKV